MNVKMDLAEISGAYLLEAVEKAISAQNEDKQWIFAILLITQSLEATVKAALHNVHPLFVYERIDEQKNTVNLLTGLNRLTDPLISKINLDEKDKKSVRSLVELRNKITHHEVEMSTFQAKKVFCVGLELVEFFQSSRLGIHIGDILSETHIQQLRDIPGMEWVSISHADHMVRINNVEEDSLASCPECSERYLSVKDNVGFCYVCFSEFDFTGESTEKEYAEDLFHCPSCQDTTAKSEAQPKDIIHLADPDFCEGRFVGAQYHLIDEYKFRVVCSKCFVRISMEVDENRLSSSDYERY